MLDLGELADTVKAHRKKLGLTQHELAAMSRVSRARIAALETHRLSDIGLRNIQRILNAVGLDFRVTALNRQRPTLEDLVDEGEVKSRDSRLVR